jgi:osmotically-inducible protein OsmY
MSWFKRLLLPLAAVVALSACAPTTTQEGTGGYIDDSVITAKVKTALLEDKGFKSTDVNVETFKGRVQLSGFVSSSSDAQRAVDTTKKVKGVTSVENDIRIK